MENISNKQWHETQSFEENGVLYFLKKYEPKSYEIKNEISWLTSTMLRSADTFRVPNIIDSSVIKGEVKMEHIDVVLPPEKEKIIEYLTNCASELHSLLRSEKLHMRTKISENEYIPYLHKFADERIIGIGKEFEIAESVTEWIHDQIAELKAKYFSVVHRDLRFRHLLFSEKDKPALIDWEFSNISEPSQDLAKLIYDSVVNHEMDFDIAKKQVIDQYSYQNKISAEELEKKITTFLPIIPLEHGLSFVKRKPVGYEKEIIKDLAFIRAVYEKNN